MFRYTKARKIEHKHDGQLEGGYSVRMVFADIISMPVDNLSF